MPIQSGQQVELRYIAEVTHGQTPGSPAMTILRTIGRNINLEKNILESEEIRSDRQYSDVRHGFNRVVGTIPYELSVASYDDWIEYAMGGSWAAVGVTGSPDMSATAPSTFNRATGSFITDGFREGDIIVTTGFTNSENNGQFRVLSVSGTGIGIEETTLVTEGSAAGRDMDIVGERIDIGTTLTTMTIERAFIDITQYQVFRGVAINNWQLSVQPERIIGGSWGLLGMSADPFSGTELDSTPTAAPTNSPLAAFEGTLYENETQIGIVTGVDLTLDNGRALEAVVGSRFSPDVFEGRANITGTATVMLQDATIFDKFINETETSMWLRMDDINATDFLNLVLPRVKYTGGAIDPPAEGPVIINMPFRALVSSVTGTSLSMQKSNV